ncbi:MAG: GDP-mannose-dependent alpha-(1-6)-phosphatidylinositol dimannoside mannosyltransferase [Actinomycetota bacterium]|jgi:alpha-1,6-mannosyltransferase
MRKIAHIANLYGPKSGGLRTTINELAKQYSDRDIDVLVIVPGPISKCQKINRILYVELSSLPIPFSGGYRVIIDIRKVKRILETFQPDVIEISDRSTLLHIAHWAKTKKIHTAVFAHERLDGVLSAFASWIPFRKLIASKWNSYTANLGSNIVATTYFAAEEFISLGMTPTPYPDSKLKIVSLGVDLEQFDPDQRHVTDVNDTLIPTRFIMAATRLSKEKDVKFLLDIAERIKGIESIECETPLVIAGSGPLEKTMKRMAEQRKLNIIFVGFLHNRSNLAKYLAKADIFLAVGPIETFGLAALEALASGTPVLCRDSAAIAEVIDQNCGVALPRDATLWAREIERIMGEDREIYRDLSRSRAESFSWSRCAENLISIYQDRPAA